MNKLFSAIFSAVVLFAACQKNEIAAPSNDGQVLYATIEDLSATRTVLDEDNNIRWSEGDQIIGFINSTLGLKYQVTASSVGQTSASFDEVGSGGLNAGTELDHVIAYYPYSSAVKVAKSGADYALEVALPYEQTYAHESFGNGSFPMVAVSHTNNITFRNVCGGMKLQLKGTAKIASIKVEGKNSEKLSGKASVTAYTDASKPSIVMADDASTSAVLNCGSGVQLNQDDATDFIISLPPTVFTKGFTITVTDVNGGAQVIETSKSNTVLRSSLLKMPVVTVEITTTPQEGDYVDEYGINHGQGIEIDGVVWAPVNCGYHATDFKYGKLYQWGRKYGQGYDNAASPSLIDAPVSLSDGQSKHNANVFYTSIVSPYEWTSVHINNLWNLGTEDRPIKTEYDPCPDGWRVPTSAECKGLIQNKSSWIKEDDKFGYWFNGSNVYTELGQQVFFQAAGGRYYDGHAHYKGSYGFYWSSSSYSANGYAYYIHFSDRDAAVNGYFCAYGSSVRCVRDDDQLIEVDNITIDKTSLELMSGNQETISARITPSNANHNIVYWWSDNPEVACVEDGRVFAISAGKATITAMAGMKTVTCTVIVTVSSEDQLDDYVDEYSINHGSGVRIGETIWAPVNCGFHKDDFKYGKLYQWGRNYGQGYSGSLLDVNGTKIGEYSDASVPSVVDGTISLLDGQSEINKEIFYRNLSGSYDWQSDHSDKLWNLGTEENPIKTEYDPCPEGWRVPTYTEYIELSQGESYWTEEDDITGRWYSQQNPSAVPSTFKVFLPAAGYRSYDYNAYARGSSGDYWTSTPNLETAFRFHFDMYYKSGMHSYRNTYAYAIRCVQDDDDLIKVERVIINQTQLTLSIDDSESLTATIIPSDANHSYAFWYSDNPEVAVVDQNGNVTAMAEGTTTITAVAGMQSVNCLVTVYMESEKKQYVDLSNNGTANCYIVSDSGAYQFAPTKGNSSESVGTIASAETLWETFGTDITPNVGDLVKNVKFENGVISFETPSTLKEGNAVIAAKDANGTILWSWHIWLTDQPEGQVYYNGAGTMMDRNLGATSATPGDVGALGLLYQWGRKDPFLGSSSISESVEAKSTITWPSAIQSDSSRGTIAYATANPLTFITHNINNLDWCFTGSFSTDNTRWASSSDAKSIYDPCPVGWRIPADDGYGVWATSTGSYNTFHGYPYDNYNFGINFSGKYGSASTIWYPSAGYRNLGSGSISNVGIDADVWLVYPLTNEMGAMSFDCNGNVAPLSSSYRANGLSVRCIQE